MSKRATTSLHSKAHLFARRWVSFVRQRYRQRLIAPAIVLALVAGTLLGRCTAIDTTGARSLLPGGAWVADVDDTRAALAGMLGFQITLVGVVVSLTMFVAQNTMSQFSPRIVSMMASSGPFRRSLVLFAFSSAFTFVAMWQLGLLPDASPAPRPAISVGILTLLGAAAFALVELFTAMRRIQVEQILRMITQGTLLTIARLREEIRRLHPSTLPPAPSDGSISIPARRTGYVVDIDLERLHRVARQAGARVHIDMTFGDDVIRGEPLGWLIADAGPTAERTATALAKAVTIENDRSQLFDVALGLRVLADVADRALSPAVNDPYTGRQCLHQMRRILVALAPLPLGPVKISDEDGRARVIVNFPTLPELLRIAIDGPSRYGAGDPDVVDGILGLTATVGREVTKPEDRAAILEAIETTLDDAAKKMDPSRLEPLRAKAKAITEALRRGNACPAVVLRPAWTVTASVGTIAT